MNLINVQTRAHRHNKAKLAFEMLEREMEVIAPDELNSFLGGYSTGTGPGDTTVRITSSRVSFGNNSTTSIFVARAYGADGKEVGCVDGYILEPKDDPALAATAGSDTAISRGTYAVTSAMHNGVSGHYQLQNVPGRSFINIHAGNTGDDTEGCLLPGTSQTSSGGNPTVSGSRSKMDELFKLLNAYGSGGITITVQSTLSQKTGN